jgi:hypothetical protein
MKLIVLYGAEKWHFKKLKRMLAMEMDFWRLSSRASKKDKIPNHVIREKIGSQNSIFDYIKTDN